MKSILVLAFLATSVWASGALADYQIQMGSVLTDSSNCANYQEGIANLATDTVAVNASCEFGNFLGSDGNYYDSEINTTLTVHSTATTVSLGAVLVDSNDCANYRQAFVNMATDNVSVDASCSFGTYVGANGYTYDSEISTYIVVHQPIASVESQAMTNALPQPLPALNSTHAEMASSLQK